MRADPRIKSGLPERSQETSAVHGLRRSEVRPVERLNEALAAGYEVLFRRAGNCVARVPDGTIVAFIMPASGSNRG